MLKKGPENCESVAYRAPKDGGDGSRNDGELVDRNDPSGRRGSERRLRESDVTMRLVQGERAKSASETFVLSAHVL